MSTRGSGRGGAEAEVRRLARRAHALRRAGRLGHALEATAAAARLLASAPDVPDVADARTHAAVADAAAPAAAVAALRAELVALECGLLSDAGRFEGAVDRLDAALAALPAPTATPDGERVRLAAARLHYEAGRVHAMLRRLPQARERLQAAAAAPDRRTLEGERGALVRIRAEAALGASLCMHCAHGEGVALLERALAAIDQPGFEAAGLERARILINLGAAHFEQHRLDPARRCVEHAMELLAPLVRARRAGARADLGRAWVNLGGVHSRAGRLAEAVTAYRAAIAAYDRARRSATLAGDVARLRASRANASLNLGYTLFKAEDFVAAHRHLRSALRRYEALLGSNPHLQADLARALVNAGHVEARRGRHARAADLYAQGLAAFEPLAGAAAPRHLAFECANAKLGLARMALARGRAAPAAAWFEQAMTTLSELTHEGALQHANHWLRAWVAQASQLVEATKDPNRPDRLGAVLLRVLAQPPLRALGEGVDPLRTPESALDAMQRWGAAPASGGTRQREACRVLAAAGLRYLFDCTAQVLADSSPAWLGQRQARIRKWVERLGAAAAAHADAPELLADWFLCTRGLRAQRAALAAGAGAPLAALRESLLELNRLEAILLGAAGERAAADAAGEPGLLPAAAGTPAPEVGERNAAAWLQLRGEVDARVAQAVRDGLLPAALQVRAADVARRLGASQALLLVARLDATRCVVLLLTAARAGAGQCGHWIACQPEPLAGLTCDLLVGAARTALRHDFGSARKGPEPSPRRIDVEAMRGDAPQDRLALDALHLIADGVLAPAIEALAATGCDDVAIVPADDLHLLPWGDLLDRAAAPARAAAVYPSAGAWWRGGERVVLASGALPRWALAGSAGAAGASGGVASGGAGRSQPLRWIEVESRLATQLWHEAGTTVVPWDAEAGAGAAIPDSLLLMGHGDVPAGNAALAAVAVGDGRLVDAHAAAARGSLRRVLLSACVLGRTDDAFGEPLGFLSACFGYRTRFGIGWLTEVPDDAACLFSLAFQHALREALAARGGGVRWGEVFGAVRRAIAAGAWPPGFAAWLGAQAPAPAAALPAEPPAALRRVLPWVVALGR
jgi:tetratricopeptide (TPR) repeat protein